MGYGWTNGSFNVTPTKQVEVTVGPWLAHKWYVEIQIWGQQYANSRANIEPTVVSPLAQRIIFHKHRWANNEPTVGSTFFRWAELRWPNVSFTCWPNNDNCVGPTVAQHPSAIWVCRHKILRNVSNSIKCKSCLLSSSFSNAFKPVFFFYLKQLRFSYCMKYMLYCRVRIDSVFG